RRGLIAVHVECSQWSPAAVSRRSVDRGRTRTAEPAVTSTYDVSLSVRPAAGFDDAALIDLFRGAAQRARCSARASASAELTSTGLGVGGFRRQRDRWLGAQSQPRRCLARIR